MKIKLVIISVLCGVILSSCDRFLDIRPTGKVIPTTSKEYRELITQAYNSVLEDRGLTTFRTDEGIMDEATSSVSDIETYKNIWIWNDDNPTGSTTTFGWRQYYHVLFIANYILENKGVITDGTPETINQLAGEAYMLRAYMHFLLVNLFAEPYTHCVPESTKGIPLKLNSNTESTLSRNTIAEVYASVENDINDAEKLLNVHQWEKGFTYRFNTVSVDAFRSRLYLYMGKWDKSLEASERVLQKKNTLTDLRVTGSVLPNNYQSVENIVAIEQIITSQYLGAMRISNTLLDKYKSGDLRKSRFYRALTASVYRLQKGGSNEFRCSFRVGEMYLNACEAALKVGGKDDVAKKYLLKLLQNRLSVNAYNNRETAINAMDNAGLLNEVLLERELELAFEGHRWFDLRRLARPELKKIFGADTYILKQNDVRYTLKIPAEAVSANPNLAN